MCCDWCCSQLIDNDDDVLVDADDDDYDDLYAYVT